MATATEREAAHVIGQARRRLRWHLATLLVFLAGSVVFLVAFGTVLGRAARWKSELTRTGSHTTGTVVMVHADDGSKGDEDRVRIEYAARDETRSFTVSPGRLANYHRGDAIDVTFDPVRTTHVRTPWDARTDGWETMSGFLIFAVVLAGGLALAGVPRAIIGVRLGAREWVAQTVVERSASYGKQTYHAYDLGEDRLFRCGTSVLSRRRAGSRRMWVAGTDRWRVVARPGVADVVRRTRSWRSDRRLRRNLGLPT